MLRAVRTRLFTLAVAAYVLLDFSSPYLPGVFSFDADQSMDGVVMSDHALGLEGSSPAVVPTSDALCEVETRRARPPRSPIAAAVEWVVVLREAYSRSSSRSSLAEAH